MGTPNKGQPIFNVREFLQLHYLSFLEESVYEKIHVEWYLHVSWKALTNVSYLCQKGLVLALSDTVIWLSNAFSEGFAKEASLDSLNVDNWSQSRNHWIRVFF